LKRWNSICLFWIQVHGPPLQNKTAINAIKIGKALGPLPEVENGEVSIIFCRHHLHIKKKEEKKKKKHQHLFV
jgi:hypothetical protein